MKQNSNTDILIERLKQNQYESELERRKDADALFAAGCAEDNDTWKSLALYYLASERITAQDEMTLDHLLGEDIRDKVTGLLMMRPFLHLADEENKRRKEGKKFVLLFYNILNFARYNYRFGLDEGKLPEGCSFYYLKDGIRFAKTADASNVHLYAQWK